MSDTSKSAVHDTVEIPLEDGTIRATRHEPAEAGPRPVILVYTPYHKDDLSDTRSDPLVAYFVDAGYEVVVADALGTGASDGLVDQPFTANEGRHGAAVVEWLADQEWSNGRVGLIGKSYPGTTALEIAAQDPDGLEAIVPIHAPARIYDAYYDGGTLAFLRTCGQWAPNFEYLPLQPPIDRDGDDWAARWHGRLAGLEDREPYLFQYLEHPTKDEYWAAKDVPVEAITVPTLAVGGYRDAFGGGTIDYTERITAPTEVILGPWRHAMPEQGETARIDFLGEVEAWFDDHLSDELESRTAQPPIRYWTERPSAEDPLDGEWRRTSAWPTAADDSTVTFDLGPTGLQLDSDAGESATDQWEVDYSVGSSSIGFEIPGGTDLDTTPDDDRSLTYETESFDDTFELTGTGEVTLDVVPDGSTQLLAVRIVDVAPDGTGRLVTHGVTRAGLSQADIDPPGEPGATPESLEPGRAYTVPVSLRPTSHVFAPGHKLRVAISGAFFPYVSPPTGSAGFTLNTGADSASRCTFPGRFHDGRAAFDDGYTFDTPQDVYGEPAAPTWETTVSHSDETVSVSLSQSYTKDLPSATFDYEMAIEARIGRTALETETIDRETTTTLRYPTETIEARVTNAVSRSSATMQYTLTRDGEQFYSDQKRIAVNRD